MASIESTENLVELARAEELSRANVVAVRTQRDRIVVDGEEAGAYLQGQLSQNVQAMNIGDASRTLLLQPQGKIDCWMRVYRHGKTTFWLDTDAGYGKLALERLQRFMLRTKAEVSLDTVNVIALRGPQSQHTVALFDSAAAIDASWSMIPGIDLFVDGVAAIPEGVAEGSAEALELFRIKSGLPAMGSELGPKTIPAAAHIVDISVDFTKGCYVGQELVARIDSRGSATPKRLCGVTGSSEIAPTAGGVILGVDGAEIGELTSVIGSADNSWLGLAYIKRAVDVPYSAQIAVADGGTANIEISTLPVA